MIVKGKRQKKEYFFTERDSMDIQGYLSKIGPTVDSLKYI